MADRFDGFKVAAAASVATEEVEIVRETARLSERALVSRRDLATLGRLSWSIPAALLLPESRWQALCGRAHLVGANLPGTRDKAAPAIARAFGIPAELAARLGRQLQANRYELAMQCVRGLRPGGWDPQIAFEGRHILDAALAKRRGAILWVSHFVFAPNVVKMALHREGYELLHVSRPEHGFSSTRFGIAALNGIRTRFEDRHMAGRIVIDRTRPAHAVFAARAALAENKVVSFTGGAWEGLRFAEAPFLGARVRLAAGPITLAKLTGAALLPALGVRNDDGGFLVRIADPIDVTAALDADAALRSAAARYLSLLALDVHRYPDQWRGWASLRDQPGAGA